MASLSIRIDDEIKARWERLSEEQGLNTSHLMRQAIIEKLEELEDFYVVRKRLSEPFEPIPAEDIWKELGLED